MFIDTNGLIVNDGALVNNGSGVGDVGRMLQDVRFDSGLLRPYIGDDGKPQVTLNNGKAYYIRDLQERGINSPVFNATSLPKNAWIEFDNAVLKEARKRLVAWTDLAATSLRTGFDGMGRMTYEYQNMNDPGEALVSMDGLATSRGDRPQFTLKSIPLPITHSDFFFSEREIAQSRNTGMPLDTTMAEAAGRRVAEMVEKTVIGTVTGAIYGTQSAGPGAHTGSSAVYGYTNFPYRSTKTDLHTPTSANPENVVEDVLEMRETLQGLSFYGPYIVYHSTSYDRFLDDDYFRTGGTSVTRTLRERLESIEGISGVRRLDFLTSGYQLLMVSLDSSVGQAIEGMQIRTLQWPSIGGLQQNFKVMAIMVPLLKVPYSGVAGIVHGTTS